MSIDYRKKFNGTIETFHVFLTDEAQQKIPLLIEKKKIIKVQINPTIDPINVEYEKEIIGQLLDKKTQQRIHHILTKSKEFSAVITSVTKHYAALELSYPREILQFTDCLFIHAGSNSPKELERLFDGNYQYVDYYVDKNEKENFTFYGQDKKLVKVKYEHGHLVAGHIAAFASSQYIDDERKLKNAKVFQMKLAFYEGNLAGLPPADSTISISAFRNFFDRIQTNPYIEQWELYKKFEVEFIKKQASYCQDLTYTAYEVLNDSIRFKLIGRPDISGWIDAGNSFAVQLEADSLDKRKEKLLLGTVRRINTDYIDIEYDFQDDLFTQVEFPKKGVLSVSTIASEVATKRREQAIRKVNNRESIIPNLGDLLNDPDKVKPIEFYPNSFAPKMLVNGYPVDANQERAINSAINTTDLVLIQGPPGAGKTSVIQTIMRSLIDLGQDNVLLTSYQHLAVNNALDGLANANMLTHRFGDKSKQHELTQSYINQINTIIDNVPIKKETARTDVSKTEELRDILMQYKRNEQLTAEDCQYLEEYLLNVNKSSSISINVFKKCINIISKFRTKVVVKENVQSTEHGLQATYDHFTEHLADWEGAVNKFEEHATSNTSKIKVKALWRDITNSSKRLKILATASKTPFEKKLAQLLNILQSNVSGIDKVLPEMSRIYEAMEEALFAIELDLSTRKEVIESEEHAILTEWVHQLKNDYTGFIQSIAQYANVKGVTCQQVFAQRHGLYDTIYDAVIIDEAARANPLDLLIPMTLGKKVILVGDHKQLPHILEPSFAEELEDTVDFNEIYEKSLFERLFTRLPVSKRITLTKQFRMHPKINNLVGELFYDNQLEAGTDPYTLVNDTGVYENQNLAWIDVPYKKDFIYEENHFSNEVEVDVLIEQVRQIRENTSQSIGIITFYNHQLSLLKKKLSHAGLLEFVEVGTVDAFQGKEKDIIFLSTVRSNTYKEPSKALGFLRSPNRLNVALSRAKRLLIIVGDSSTLVKEPLFARIYDYIKENGYVTEFSENKTPIHTS